MLVMFLRFPEERVTGIVLVTWAYRTQTEQVARVKLRHLGLVFSCFERAKRGGKMTCRRAVVETSVYV